MREKHKFKYLIGIDEAGRGPLAGPVAVAAVISQSFQRGVLGGIKDSKKLSAKKREEWDIKLKAQSEKLKTSVVFVGPKIIDKIGISKAIAVAVKLIIKKLEKRAKINSKNCFIFLDGALRAPKKYAQKTIIKGDETVPVISAASIVAKVARDEKMARLHKKFPQYGFSRHKGYGTKLHYEKIKKHGLCEIHRKSFSFQKVEV